MEGFKRYNNTKDAIKHYQIMFGCNKTMKSNLNKKNEKLRKKNEELLKKLEKLLKK
jgi:hypothetical protein